MQHQLKQRPQLKAIIGQANQKKEEAANRDPPNFIFCCRWQDTKGTGLPYQYQGNKGTQENRHPPDTDNRLAMHLTLIGPINAATPKTHRLHRGRCPQYNDGGSQKSDQIGHGLHQRGLQEVRVEGVLLAEGGNAAAALYQDGFCFWIEQAVGDDISHLNHGRRVKATGC